MEPNIESVKLIVGLGNVGKEYEKTRHNVGFMFCDVFKKQFLGDMRWKQDTTFKASFIKTPGNEFILAKPTTMMNNSGEAVKMLSFFYGVEPQDVLIIHDDLDISLGDYKLQFGTGPKVHNGLSSVDKFLGTNQYWHLRIGIENREVKGNKGIPGQRYALERFKPEEYKTIQSTIQRIIAEEME